MKVMHCLNGSWIHESYHSLRTLQLTSVLGECSGGYVRGNVWIPQLLRIFELHLCNVATNRFQVTRYYEEKA